MRAVVVMLSQLAKEQINGARECERKNDYQIASNQCLPASKAALHLEVSDVDEHPQLCSVPQGSFRLCFLQGSESENMQILSERRCFLHVPLPEVLFSDFVIS